jgi:hypothetical protein
MTETEPDSTSFILRSLSMCAKKTKILDAQRHNGLFETPKVAPQAKFNMAHLIGNCFADAAKKNELHGK